jgi:phosphoribosylformylglycinamidine cyclo-ligase
MSSKYAEAGVSLEKGYESVNKIMKHTKRTTILGTEGNIGNFGGLFDLSAYNIKKPILVSGTDGVGTKILIAQEANIHNTIGIDLVAMCVNDVLCMGAKPLIFLDYIAIGETKPEIIEQIVEGISNGCIEAGCALIGGETAEMRDLYINDHYDLAGYTTGVVDKAKLLDPRNVSEGDILIGLESSGIHSNGYSLVRKIFFKDHNYSLETYFDELNSTLKDELLKPTKIYVKGVLECLKHCDVKAISHITGGGFIENIPRVLNDNQGVLIEEKNLPKKPIFSLLEELGKIPHQEMYNIFNMGIGMILFINSNQKEKIFKILENYNYKPRVIGIVTNTPGVVIKQ